MANNNHTEVIFGLYDDEEDLLNAVRADKRDHLDIYDVFTPVPVRGVDPILGLEESRVHEAGFICGVLGALTAVLGMTLVFT